MEIASKRKAWHGQGTSSVLSALLLGMERTLSLECRRVFKKTNTNV